MSTSTSAVQWLNNNNGSDRHKKKKNLSCVFVYCLRLLTYIHICTLICVYRFFSSSFVIKLNISFQCRRMNFSVDEIWTLFLAHFYSPFFFSKFTFSQIIVIDSGVRKIFFSREVLFLKIEWCPWCHTSPEKVSQRWVKFPDKGYGYPRTWQASEQKKVKGEGCFNPPPPLGVLCKWTRMHLPFCCGSFSWQRVPVYPVGQVQL